LDLLGCGISFIQVFYTLVVVVDHGCMHEFKIVFKSMWQWFQLNNAELFLAKNKYIYIHTVTSQHSAEVYWSIPTSWLSFHQEDRWSLRFLGTGKDSILMKCHAWTLQKLIQWCTFTWHICMMDGTPNMQLYTSLLFCFNIDLVIYKEISNHFLRL
jgi:hypothetical protein